MNRKRHRLHEWNENHPPILLALSLGLFGLAAALLFVLSLLD